MSKIFETKVVAVGPEAQGMIKGANMLILFGADIFSSFYLNI